MQIEERIVGEVTILDLKGKMTLGEGDELLKDKINSLIHQGKKKLLLNLEGVPYIDSAGLGEIVRTYTTVSRQGGSSEAGEPDQADHRPAVDHQAADGLRDVRRRKGRDRQLPVGQRLRPTPASALPWRAVHTRISRYPSRR